MKKVEFRYKCKYFGKTQQGYLFEVSEQQNVIDDSPSDWYCWLGLICCMRDKNGNFLEDVEKATDEGKTYIITTDNIIKKSFTASDYAPIIVTDDIIATQVEVE